MMRIFFKSVLFAIFFLLYFNHKFNHIDIMQLAECRMQNAECRMKVAFRFAKSIFIEKVCVNIGVLGVPSSPAAAGASPRRSQGVLLASFLLYKRRTFLNS
jgi:hypothetical protein